MKFGLHRDVRPHHELSMDGASSGFENRGITGSPNSDIDEIVETYSDRKVSSGSYKGAHEDHMFRDYESLTNQILRDTEAYECGFGYEELNGIFPHKTAAYDEAGVCRDPERLKNFVRNNLYLSDSIFDYDNIDGEFKPSTIFRTFHPLFSDSITESDCNSLLEEVCRTINNEEFQSTAWLSSFENKWRRWVGSNYSICLEFAWLAHNYTFSALREFVGGGEIILSRFASTLTKRSVVDNGFNTIYIEDNSELLPFFSETSLKENITEHTRAIVVTHAWGFNRLSDELLAICSESNIKLIEEVLPSPGATFKKEKVGAFGLASIFHMTLSRGDLHLQPGVVCTSDDEFFQLLKKLRQQNLVEQEKAGERVVPLGDDILNIHSCLPTVLSKNSSSGNLTIGDVIGILGVRWLRQLNRANSSRTNNLFRFIDGLDSELFETTFSVEGNCAQFFPVILRKEKITLENKVREILSRFGVEFLEGLGDDVEFIGDRRQMFLIGNQPNIDEQKIDFILRVLNNVEREFTPIDTSQHEILGIGGNKDAATSFSDLYWAARKELRRVYEDTFKK